MAELSSETIAEYPTRNTEQQQAIREAMADLLVDLKDVASGTDFNEIMSKLGFVPNP